MASSNVSAIRESILAVLAQHGENYMTTDILRDLRDQSSLMLATRQIREMIKQDPWEIGLKNPAGLLNNAGLRLHDMIEVLELDQFSSQDSAATDAVVHFNVGVFLQLKNKKSKAQAWTPKKNAKANSPASTNPEWPVVQEYDGIRVKFHYSRQTCYIQKPEENEDEEDQHGKKTTSGRRSLDKATRGDEGDDEDEGDELEPVTELEFSISVNTEAFGEFFPMLHFTASADGEYPGPFYKDIESAQRMAKEALEEQIAQTHVAPQRGKGGRNKKAPQQSKAEIERKEKEVEALMATAEKFEDPVSVNDLQFNPELLEDFFDNLNLPGNKLDTHDLMFLLLAMPFHEMEWDLQERLCDLLFNMDFEGDE
eukprot:CAMPEP_0175154902 /NCGR_PEP_ID=MMETSP0087-20121206/20650_1 /TAXON_ID=136419 /ORGANISM="Unknown Unknown, Strain D1" /LENGTH=367 /DNA_ID=CAMNT_0016441943 /DNA_START=74 /DNA_END=1174 /DNA_ORIENTATION=-